MCGRNRLRSPTAQQVFSSWPGIETDSAGLNPDADVALSADQIEWADIIFVMEPNQRGKIAQQFRSLLRKKRVVCLDIPDIHAFMAPDLVETLIAKAGPLLR